MLAEHADYFAGSVPDIGRMLDVALLVMRLREAENRLYRLDGFTHSPERPGLFLFIDESHAPFADPAIQAKALTVAREGRKLGVAIIAASQAGTMDAFGIGQTADTLRSCLLAGNLLILRCESNNPKNIFGLDIDPKKFPAWPGYAFLVDKTGEGRSAPLRCYNPGDRDTREAWAARFTWRGLDEGAANAAGPLYRTRHDHAEADMAALAETVAALRAGRPVPAPTARDATPASPGPATPRPALNVIQFPSWPPAPPAPGSDAAAAARDRRLSKSHLAVLRAVGAGHRTNAAIRQVTGWQETHVRNLLNALVDWNYLMRTEPYGTFARTRQGTELVTDPGDPDAELLTTAVELVVSTQAALPTVLEHRLQIGPVHAGRLLDRLEQLGVVGPADAAQRRDVLITPDRLAEALERARACLVA
jgi:hypothetical protein